MSLTLYAEYCALEPALIINVTLTTVCSFIQCSIITVIGVISLKHICQFVNNDTSKHGMHPFIYYGSIITIIMLLIAAWTQLFQVLICEIGYHTVNLTNGDLSIHTWFTIISVELLLFAYNFGLYLLYLMFLFRLYFIFKNPMIQYFGFSNWVYILFTILWSFTAIVSGFGIITFFWSITDALYYTGIARITYSLNCVLLLSLFTRALYKVKNGYMMDICMIFIVVYRLCCIYV